MIAHYLTSALANFRKSPFTTAANVLTLALGLACFIAAFGIATYWRSADGYHANADRTYVIGQSIDLLNDSEPAFDRTGSTPVLAEYLEIDFPEIERLARATPDPGVAIAAGPNRLFMTIAAVDPEFLQIFDLNFIAGDPRGTFDQPGSVILTEAAAQRLFGDAPALGQSVMVDNTTAATVTGVIALEQRPTFMGQQSGSPMAFDFMMDWDSSPNMRPIEARPSWTRFATTTFVQLAPGASLEALNAAFPAFVDRRLPAADKEDVDFKLSAFPVGELTTRNLDEAFLGQNALGLTTVGALMALGLLILAVACLNYANLTAAQTALRTRQTGLRRVLGAGRASVMAQIWLEVGLLTLAAGAVALIILMLVSPVLRTAMDVWPLYFLSTGAGGWLALAAVLCLVAFLAGTWPAVTLSRARPAEALRKGRSRSGSGLAARILVGLQFLSASLLLILVTVTHLQRTEMERVSRTSAGDGVVVALNDLRAAEVEFDTLRERLLREPSVGSVTVTEYLPWGSASVSRVARTDDSAADALSAFRRRVGFDYFEVLDLDLIGGRTFTEGRDAPQPDLSSASPPSYDVVVDQALSDGLGFATPQAAVGQTIYMPGFRPLNIIGVTRTEPRRLEDDAFTGSFYVLVPKADGRAQYPLVRLSGDDVSAITKVWNELAPNAALDIQYYDELFEEAYSRYDLIGRLFIILAATAFAIASLGLLAVAVHVAARRRHEIAVRKTLGSTTWGAVRLLLTDFSKPVIVANLIAWPLGYLAAETYLSAFAHRIELSIWPFAASMLITLLIAWLAVGGQTYRAASVRPAQVLRDA